MKFSLIVAVIASAVSAQSIASMATKDAIMNMTNVKINMAMINVNGDDR